MKVVLDNRWVDTETGEATSPYDTSGSGTYEQNTYDPPLVWSTIESRRALEDYFQEDINNPTIRVRWTNDALEVLLRLNTELAEKYIHLSKRIIARNIVFDTNDALALHLGIDKSNLPRLWQSMRKNGLLRVCTLHNGGRRYKKILLNPSLVFKTYNQQGKEYSSSLTFSQVHQHYLDMWITSALEGHESL